MKRTALISLLILCVVTAQAVAADENAPSTVSAAYYSVMDFGAKGDGETDDTKAFTAAMNAASEAGGGVVFLPTGNFLIKTHLEIPQFVTLKGVWNAPPVTPEKHGSTLLAVEGKGDKDGTPFITMNRGSTLDGISIFYPEQIDANPPHPYPWTVRASANGADNCSIVDVLMVNPYQAVDFGTNPAGRHYIKGLYGQPLYRGIYIDNCFDVGRIEDVHFWPFWKIAWETLIKFTQEQGEAFVLGRTDWEMVSDSFCIFYKIGFHFIEGEHGPGNVMITQSGADIGPCAVQVDKVMKHAGISFANCQFMTKIVVSEDNPGPVKFDGCGFWPVKDATSHAVLAGTGQVTFENCHFSEWDKQKTGAPCIDADCEGITITACDFMDKGEKQIVLGENVKSAIITSNQFRGGKKIENNSKGNVQIGLNTDR